jgi:hypothetical protein
VPRGPAKCQSPTCRVDRRALRVTPTAGSERGAEPRSRLGSSCQDGSTSVEDVFRVGRPKGRNPTCRIAKGAQGAWATAGKGRMPLARCPFGPREQPDATHTRVGGACLAEQGQPANGHRHASSVRTWPKSVVLPGQAPHHLSALQTDFKCGAHNGQSGERRGVDPSPGRARAPDALRNAHKTNRWKNTARREPYLHGHARPALHDERESQRSTHDRAGEYRRSAHEE